MSRTATECLILFAFQILCDFIEITLRFFNGVALWRNVKSRGSNRSQRPTRKKIRRLHQYGVWPTPCLINPLHILEYKLGSQTDLVLLLQQITPYIIRLITPPKYISESLLLTLQQQKHTRTRVSNPFTPRRHTQLGVKLASDWVFGSTPPSLEGICYCCCCVDIVVVVAVPLDQTSCCDCGQSC